MKSALILILMFVVLFLTVGVEARAQTPALTVTQGGTGWKAFPSGYLLFGSTSLRLGTSTNLFWDDVARRLSFTFGSTTAISGTNATFTSFVGALTGNASTATALSANGTNASAGNAILGVDASGNAEGAFDVWTEAENTSAAYTPQSRTLTIEGTANQITSSAGAQDLSANRTWTLSLPSHVIFPGNYQATNATTTNATTTALDITQRLTFGGSTGTTWSAFCTAITGSADLCDGSDASGAAASAYEIATTSSIAVPQLAYFTQASGRTTLGGAATTTLTVSGPFNNSATPVVLGASPITSTYWGLATTTALTSSHLLYSTNGAAGVAGVATTTFTPSAEFTVGGTLGAFVGGANSTLTIATAGVALTKLATQAANTVLVNQTSAAASPTALATSTFANGLYSGTAGQVLARLTNGTWTGVATTTFSSGLTYSNGNVTADLGTSIIPSELNAAITANQIPYANSAGTAFVGVATSSLNLGVSGGGTGVTSFGGTNTILYTSAANTLTSEAAFTYDQSTNTFTTDNGIVSTSLRIPNSTGPTTDAAGEIAFDTDAWTRGAVQAYDGTANTYLVGVLTSDTPSNGQVPQWNTGGTITWETPTGGGAGSTHWATTSPWSGKYVLYPSDTGADLCLSASATSSCKFWFDVDNSIEYIGQFGAADSFISFSPTGNATTTLGLDYSTNNFSISVSNTLGTNEALVISTSTLNIGLGTSTPWGALSIVQDASGPEFVIATSSNTSHPGQDVLFFVDATTTGKLDYARVAIGTTSPWGSSGLRDQFTVDGRIYTTWRTISCDFPGSSFVSAPTADTVGACGGFSFDFDADGTGVITNHLYPPAFQLRAGSTNATVGDGSAFRTSYVLGSATTSPVFEAWVRPSMGGTSTSTPIFMVGLNNDAFGSDLGNSLPSQGAYFVATSSPNWKVVTRSATNVETMTDTGIATSSTEFRKFRVELTDTEAVFLNNGNVITRHTTNIPTANLAPIVRVGVIANGGTNVGTPSLYVARLFYAMDDPLSAPLPEARPPKRSFTDDLLDLAGSVLRFLF